MVGLRGVLASSLSGLRAVGLGLGLLGLTGCGLVRRPEPPLPPPPSAEDLDLELRALLLLIEDRALFEPTVVAQTLVSRQSATREALARALGRIDDPRGRDVLLELMADPVESVRRAAAFALGWHPSPVVVASLEGVAGGEDREVASAAVASLARLGVSLGEVLESLRRLEGEEVWRRIVPALFRFSAEERYEAARLALGEGPGELHRLAGLALAWNPPPRAAPDLRALLADDDAFVRAAAAAALGAVGDARDLVPLAGLLAPARPAPGAATARATAETTAETTAEATAEKPAEAAADVTEQVPAEASKAARGVGSTSPVEVVAALGAVRALVVRGLVAPPAELRGRLPELFSAPDAGVRRAAIAASSVWLLDEDLEAALDRRFVDLQAPVGERAAALMALASGGAARAADRVSDASVSRDPFLRRAAARAAARSRQGGVVTRLLGDVDPGVRAAALSAAFDLGSELGSDPGADLEGGLDLEAVAQAARRDRSAAVRGTLFERLRERPLLSSTQLVGPAGGDTLERERSAAVRRSLVLALAARARAERLERGAVLETLETVAERDGERAVREAARSALSTFDREAPEARALPSRAELPAYRAIVALSTEAVDFALVTERGRIGLRTDCRPAPKSCLNLFQLARQGFYQGQRLEGSSSARQELAFGDPSATGFGDAGYRSVPELSAFLPDQPGLLLLDCSGSSGCGSRLRLLLAPQPWLADETVLLARVVSGLEVARQLSPGDEILSIEAPDSFRIVEP